MRYFNRYIKFIVVVLATGVISCETGLSTISVPARIYLPQAEQMEIIPLLGESAYALQVYKSGINQDASASVTASVDVAESGAFIEAHPEFSLLPEHHYSLPSAQISFGKGEESKPLIIRFHRIDESLSDTSYVLPVRLQDVTGGAELAENKRLVFLTVKRFRNPYEGPYRIYGSAIPQNGISRKIEMVANAYSVSPDAVTIQGPEDNMKLQLTVSDGKVLISAAPGSEDYRIQHTPGTESTYSGKFDTDYQRNTGRFILHYSYTLNEQVVNVVAEMNFWL